MKFVTKIFQFVQQPECIFENGISGTSIICYAEVYVQVTHRYFENFCNISLF